MNFVSARAAWVLALVALVWQLSLLNNASANAYFALTLQNWEQGQFIRFHGLIQWLGWLWPRSTHRSSSTQRWSVEPTRRYAPLGRPVATR